MSEHHREEPEEGLGLPEDAAPRAGATPPAESGLSALGAPERRQLKRGWGPVPVAATLAVAGLVAFGLIAMAVVLILR